MDVASSSESAEGSSDSVIELNVKTLDSQIYSFRVDKNALVSSFKEKIAEKVGLPVVQQRLIFRGKVLKDEHLLSEYHVENGHTLHLVERQPAQSQPSSGPSSGEANASNIAQGNEGNDGAPRNRIGRISHSVVLGTFNVGPGEQGEGGVPDVNRVIGAVLNSLGIGGQGAPSPGQNFAASLQSTASGQAPPGFGSAAEHGNTGGQTQAGNATQPGQSFPNQPFQFPLTHTSVPLPSLHAPIPDSLNTLSDFMSRMEGVFSQIGNSHDQSSSVPPEQSPTELPSNAAEMPTPEALTTVLRRAEQLLGGGASASLLHIAGRLERDLSSTDTSVRSQVQSELVQAGLSMQHLGALFLELGRTILTMRMGQSPAESVINSGPAVYISPQGPNPLMVQPFPLQTSPLFNTGNGVNIPPTPATLGQIGVIGSVPRHINIHIHAGTAFAPMVSAAGARPGNTEGAQGENTGTTVPSGSGFAQVLRNVTAAAVPRPTVGVSSAPSVGPFAGDSASQTEDTSSIVAEINADLRQLLERQRSSVELARGDQGSVQETVETNIPLSEAQKVHDQSENQQEGTVSLSSNLFQASSSSSNERSAKSDDTPREYTQTQDVPDAAKSVPLGLGLSGLQPKRRTQASNVQLKNGESGASGVTSVHSPSTIAAGQQVLQSLALNRSSIGSDPSSQAASRQIPRAPAPSLEAVPIQDQVSRSQPDMMGLMSQVLGSPAFSGILSGIAGQTGAGSADDVRGMFQQLTQSPDARNTINQIAQQVSGEDVTNMFAGSGRSQGGGMDFSSMIQQMMPIVSRALSGNSGPTDSSLITLERDPQPEPASTALKSEIDVQEVVQRINTQRPPPEILRAVLEASLLHGEAGSEELVDELCANEDLANEFMETLSNDLQRRFQDGSS